MRFQRLDSSHFNVHFDMNENDNCYFLREYTSRSGFQAGETNNLVLNLKKTMDRRGRPEWRYKEQAIGQCAREIGAALVSGGLVDITLVPVPPSKAPDDPLYDDRMIRVCRKIQQNVGVNFRELVYQEDSFPADHEQGSGQRRTIEQIASAYRINQHASDQEIANIGIIDDVLTNGRHFQAMKGVLAPVFPGVPLLGIFFARRIFPFPFDPIETSP